MGRLEYLMPRTPLYHLVAGLDTVDAATHAAASKVEERANQNLAAAHKHVRIVPHTPFRIELTKVKTHPSTYDVSLVGDNPVALEYGHAPSGAFDPNKIGYITKAPAGQYILHRAADLPGAQSVPTGRISGGVFQRRSDVEG